jgi:molybdopterin-containing oxidoreductase family membrane subunit
MASRSGEVRHGLIVLPAAIMLHPITAWIFGLQISRGFWYSSIMAPMFIASALVSGLGLVILLALVLRRLGRLHFTDDLVAMLGGLLGAFIGVEAFLLLAEYLTALYPGAPEGEAAARMLSVYLPLFLFEVVVGLLIPFLILTQRRLRTNPVWVSVAAIAISTVHREPGLNGLSYPHVDLPPGLPSGRAGRLVVRGGVLLHPHRDRVADRAGGPVVRGAAVHGGDALPADAGA